MIKIGKMLEQVLDSLVRKPATCRYPYEKAVMPPNFRGKLKFYPEKCIGCRLCMKDCPSGAIQINHAWSVINKVGEASRDTQPDVFAKPSEATSAQRLGAKEGEKRFEAVISLDKCIYCAQCVDTCPKKALAITPEFELAQLDRKNLKVVFPPPACNAGA